MLLLSQKSISINKARIAILGFSFKENIPDIRNTKVIQIINELNKWNVNVQVFDSIVSQEEVKKEYGIKVKKFKDIKESKFDAIILAVSHKEFIKKLSFYNPYFKNKSKKIIIDVKNNFTENELKKNKYYFFQL
jgi:UDP-N-acetyl-D-galactosamine dehydrogenase